MLFHPTEWLSFQNFSNLIYIYINPPSTAAAKSLQSCPTLCDLIDGSPPGSSVPGILQARTMEWVAISFSNAWKWKVKVKSLSRVRLLATPWTAAYQAPPSMGFSRQEYWSGVPLPSPPSTIGSQHSKRVPSFSAFYISTDLLQNITFFLIFYLRIFEHSCRVLGLKERYKDSDLLKVRPRWPSPTLLPGASWCSVGQWIPWAEAHILGHLSSSASSTSAHRCASLQWLLSFCITICVM